MDTLQDVALDRLDDEIGELAAHIAAATCRWLELIAEVDRREGYQRWGFGSCSGWLAWRCSLSPAAAREHVRVARQLTKLPLVRGAFADGALTYSKARALTRVASAENESQLLMLAQHATAAQLERIVRLYRGVVATQCQPDQRAENEHYLTYSWSDDGALELRGRLPAAEGAVVVKAIELARDQLRVSDEAAADTAGHVPTNVDAIALMAETVLTTDRRQGSAAERYQVVVHVERDAIAHDSADARCELEDAAAVAPETARRLACDASIVTILEQNGRPLSVGRRTRAIPPAVRRALRSRDGGCRFPGCAQRRFVDAHHIDHWARGGETKLSNLVQLCRRHHRLLHEGGFSLERQGDRLTFRRPDGRVVPAVPRPRRGEHAVLVRTNHRRGVQPDADTCLPLSGGDRFDYGLTIDGLLHADGLHTEAVPAAASAEARAAPG